MVTYSFHGFLLFKRRKRIDLKKLAYFGRKMINISLHLLCTDFKSSFCSCDHMANLIFQLRQYSSYSFPSILTLCCPFCRFILLDASKMLPCIVCYRFLMPLRGKNNWLRELGKRKFQMFSTFHRPVPVMILFCFVFCFFASTKTVKLFLGKQFKTVSWSMRLQVKFMKPCRFETGSV